MVSSIEIMRYQFAAALSVEIERYAAKRRADTNTLPLFDEHGNRGWEEKLHPRVEKGSTTGHGGRFTKASGTGSEPSKKRESTLEEKLFGSRGKDVKILQGKIYDEVNSNGHASLIGKSAANGKELAELAQIYRDPRYETFRVFLEKDGVIVGHNAYTSRLPSVALVPGETIDQLRDDMVATGATGYYVMHNHPTGDPTPSRDDLAVTRKIAQEVPGMKSHVIIDHNKGSIISPDGMYGDYDLPNEDLQDLSTAQRPGEYLGESIDSPEKLARLGMNLRPENGRAVVVFCNAKMKTRMLVDVSMDNLGKVDHKLVGALRRAGRAVNSGNFFAVLPHNTDLNDWDLRKLVSSSLFTDVVTGDGKSMRDRLNQPVKPHPIESRIKATNTVHELQSSKDSYSVAFDVDVDLDQYARRRADTNTMSLFDEEGNSAIGGKKWDEDLHPRAAKGSTTAHGGQFVKKEAGSDNQQPGIIQPETTVDNSKAKSGDQLGLFGEATKAKPVSKPFVPTLLGQGETSKAKQQSMFETAGHTDQMNLFSDGSEPEGMVHKPKEESSLPDGWTESQPGGMATDGKGNIVDKEIVSGKWFAIHDGPLLDGFDSRSEAFNALRNYKPEVKKPEPFKPTLLDKKKDEEATQEEKPKDGDRDESGLVFRNGRWHREDEEDENESDFMPEVDYNKVAPHIRDYAKADPKRWAKLVGANDEETPNAEHNPTVRHEFENGYLVAPIQQVESVAARAKRRGFGAFKGYEPMTDDDLEASIDTPFQQEVMSDNHPRKVKFTHRMELKNALPRDSKKLVTFAKRLTKAKFLEQYGDHSAAVQSSTGLPIGEFWKQVNNGPSAKEEPKPGDASPLFDTVKAKKSEGFKPSLLDQPKPETKPAPSDDKSPIAFRDRKSFAQKMAADGKSHSEIVDAMTSRGVAAVDARRNAALALGDVAQGVVAKPMELDSKPMELSSKPMELGPKDGDKDENGLVFRNGRWHRDDNELAASAETESPKPSTENPLQSDSPRQISAATQKQLDSDYEFARASDIRNAGQDLKGSARHKINEWKNLAEAEKDGTAERLVTRDNLLKAEPHNLVVHAEKNPLTALTMHYALRSFPAKPGTRKGGDAKKDREQYLEAYRSIKEKADEIASSELSSDPRKALNDLRDHVASLIYKYRGQKGNDSIARATATDPRNQTANDLVDLHSDLRTVRVGKTYPISRIEEFSREVKSKLGDISSGSLDEKKAYMAKVTSHAQDIIEGKSLNKTFGNEAKKVRRFDPAEAYVKRAERKGGRDVSKVASDPNKATGHMVDSMGLRGVQWGNTVTDDERKHHASKALEALTDLTDVLGLHPKDISLDGKLGLAIGARGKGMAMAHYEPGTQVINLTRANGIGTLAHEWGHGFDHMLSGFTISQKSENRSGGDYFSEDFERTHELHNPKQPGARVWKATETSEIVPSFLKEGYERRERPMLGVRKAYQEWHKASQPFLTRLKRQLREDVANKIISRAKADGYWASGREVFARSFEQHVQHKLRDKGNENTYLAGLGNNGGYWPTKEESIAMAPAFDKIFEEYRKHKHGSSEPVKYSAREAFDAWGPILIGKPWVSIDRYGHDSDDLRYDITAEDHRNAMRYSFARSMGVNIDRYEWNEAAHPRERAGTSLGGEFKARDGGQGTSTTLAANSSSSAEKSASSKSVDQFHHLHASNLPRGIAAEHFNAVGSLHDALGYDWRHAKTDQEFDEAFAKVDKQTLQAALENINALDRKARSQGIAYSDYANANNTIPPQLAKRLGGGSRFFDRNQIADKIAVAPEGFAPKVSPEQHAEQMADELLKAISPDQWQKKHAGNDYQDLRNKTVAGPNGPYHQPIDPPPQAKSKPGAEGKTDQKPDPIHEIAGISQQASNRLNREIQALIGSDNPAIIADFRSIVEASHRDLSLEVSEHNEALRALSGEKGLGGNVGWARNTSGDYSTKKNFDTAVDVASTRWPHLFQGHDKENAAMELLKKGKRDAPRIYDQEVIDRAMAMAGSSFFEGYENYDPNAEPVENEMELIPFSWRAAKVDIDLIRYRSNLGSIDRYRLLTFKELDCFAKQHQKPTEAQIEAGNYRKGHISFQGLDISIETPKGKRRRPEWPPMAAHYGDIKGTTGKDGDPIDVFVGPDLKSELVYVVDQVDQNGKFDEHKALIGFRTRSDAVECYKKCYTPSWKVGPVTSMTIEQFKAWLNEGNHKQTIGEQVSKYSAVNRVERYFANAIERHETLRVSLTNALQEVLFAV